jgi:hypothetical protein
MSNGDYWSLRRSAISDITRQLEEQGGKGAVWVTEWKEWYQRDLGTIRTFIESLPDLYLVVPEGDRKYHVELVRHKGKGGYGKSGGYHKGGAPMGGSQGGFRSGPQGMGFGWGKGGGFWSKTTADAIKEIKAQLIDQGGTGKIWVDNWGHRFQPELGPLRQFLEARYDKFQINPGKGASFTVSLVGYYPEMAYGGSSWDKGKGYTSKGKGYKGEYSEYKPTWQPMQKTTETNTGGNSKSGKRWVPKETGSEADEEEPQASAEVEEGERPSAFDDPIDDLDSPK